MSRYKDDTEMALSAEGSIAAAARDRRKKAKMRRQEDRDVMARLNEMFDECGAKFAKIMDHIDSESATIEQLKLDTREILKRLQPT